MTVETASDIAREPRKGVNGSNGTQAWRRLAVHELPIPGSADSLRKALAIASHRLPTPPFPRHPEKCGHVEPDPKLATRCNGSRATGGRSNRQCGLARNSPVVFADKSCGTGADGTIAPHRILRRTPYESQSSLLDRSMPGGDPRGRPRHSL